MDIECGIAFLRELASRITQTSDRAIIMTSHGPLITGAEFESIKYVEFVSAVTVPSMISGKTCEENPVATITHHRWIFRKNFDSTQPFPKHLRDDETDTIEQRKASIKASGETPEEDEQNDFTILAKILWNSVKITRSKDFGGDLERFRNIYGDFVFGLFVLKSHGSRSLSLEDNEKLISSLSRPILSTEILDLRLLNPNRLHDYMCVVIGQGADDSSPKEGAARGVRLLSEKHRLSINCYDSLMAINLAQNVYDDLDEATISLSLVTSGIPIYNSR